MEHIGSQFDASEYLDDEETIASYISSAMEADNPDVLRMALEDVVKARRRIYEHR